jgi:selenocysteine lyase/cysteine desulfurase
VDYALAVGLENIHARIKELASTLRAALSTLPGVTVTDIGRPEMMCGLGKYTSNHPWINQAPEYLGCLLLTDSLYLQ